MTLSNEAHGSPKLVHAPDNSFEGDESDDEKHERQSGHGDGDEHPIERCLDTGLVDGRLRAMLQFHIEGIHRLHDLGLESVIVRRVQHFRRLALGFGAKFGGVVNERHRLGFKLDQRIRALSRLAEEGEFLFGETSLLHQILHRNSRCVRTRLCVPACDEIPIDAVIVFGPRSRSIADFNDRIVLVLEGRVPRLGVGTHEASQIIRRLPEVVSQHVRVIFLVVSPRNISCCTRVAPKTGDEASHGHTGDRCQNDKLALNSHEDDS
ncbi:hypothetical protein [Ensifer sp. ENS02]|uniref:hypothetical protein n=1 Tax=Ensifer sp. ENS02 TaxID=2769290 RepID=UPI0032B2C794